MCCNPLSYTEAKLHSIVDSMHIHTEFLKPYLARQLSPPKTPHVIYQVEAAREEDVLHSSEAA